MRSSKTARRLGRLASLGVLLAAGTVEGATGAAEQARQYLQRHRHRLGLTASDLREVALSSHARSAHNGVTHVYLQQRHRGIDVHNAILNLNVGRDGSVLSAGNRFVAGLAAAAQGQVALRTPAEAAHAAAERLGLRPLRPFDVLERKAGAEEPTLLSGSGIAARPIEARLVWLPLERRVRLAWRVEIEPPGGSSVWHSFVDAGTGEVLFQEDLVEQDSVEAIAAAIARPRPSAGEGVAPSFPDIDGSAYNVFASPLESPNDGSRSVVSGAADPQTSPFGWHDVDGIAGADHTRTRGNNVHAYTDVDANNIPDPGSDPEGGPGLQFDFPLDLTQAPAAYRPAAVTNLFYWNNVMHDVTARFGFDEAAGNFQVRNYTGAPGAGDDVRAEAQDGSGTNNANFFTPAQNALVPRPRMQMFVWTHPRPNTVTVPAGGAAGVYEASGAAFGRTLTQTGPVSGTLTLVNDAAGASATDGCEALVGFPAGHIALLDRGNCTFVVKVSNAQAAGAVAVVVANNVAGNPITMGGTAPASTIPSVMVTQDEGALFKAHVPFAATLAADPTRISRDSDLDAGVIAHEYGHGISNRLTGGPNNVACLGNQEQMGEGWSDWFALTLTTHPSDNRLTPRGVGSYLVFQPGDGRGIRPTPYTTDMSVNPSTYDSLLDTANISTPHGVGYVWNTMLWEVYWNLVDRYGYSADAYGAWHTAGNNLAFQLVMDGMKFQPCTPGFVDGRNAILQADAALTGGANRCEIWRGFAKRGLGFSANQGLSTSRFDGTSAFDLPASCQAATFGGFEPPVENPPAVNDRNAGSAVPVKFVLGGAAPALDSQPVDCATLLPTGEAPAPLETVGGGIKRRGDHYHVNWKTDPAWAGTCRRLTLRIPAPSDGVAYFRFH